MAAGLQCPGCGHVHPAGLPEIARGDATFRCYGCYRTLSVPEGWTGRPAPRRSGAEPSAAADAPAGAGTRDARRARLAGRGWGWRDPGAESSAGGAAGVAATGGAGGAVGSVAGARSDPGAGGGDATQMVPATGRDGASTVGAAARPPLAGAGHPPPAPGAAATKSQAPLGWVAPRRSGRPVPAAIRALVWAVAFGLAFVVTVVGLKEAGVLGVGNAIDFYAGTGVRRFGILLVLLPLWALLSAVLAHFTLEALARRRRPRPVSRRSSANPSASA
ncbi:MAG TPA: hypothetical protein VFE55_12140 [Acidimicrobiia bacterium]|nr:hypothetical protein [Acidimicrobiia bacterium]